MHKLIRFSTCSALAIALATAAAAQEARQPVPKPAGEAKRAQIMEYRDGTISSRYQATMSANGIVDQLISEALDGDDEGVDGDYLIDAALQPDTSDLPGIRERGFIRLAVSPDPLMIAYDGEQAIGVAMDIAQELEKHLKSVPGSQKTPTVVVPMPTPRSVIDDALENGRTDFTALTMTDGREDRFDFTQPLLTDVNDVLVLGADIGPVDSLDDMVGIPIFVQDGGRYSENLKKVNAIRAHEGKEPLQVKYVDERLDDYDLIELVEIGLIPATVMSSFKANFWNKVYTSVNVRQDMELTKDGRIAWAVRANNPKLRDALDSFADKVKKGTLLGNIILERYTSNANWIENIDNENSKRLISEVEPVIRKYSETFDFEPELVLAQAYQESKLDQTKRSHVGAIGVMQVMPATAADPVVGIPDVSGLDNNVHAGIKYLRWLRDTWFDDPEITPLDQTLLAFAAYNAGPGGVKRARKRAVQMGLDPNVWFENVEVAIQRAVSREPAIYVRNIFKYYVSYRLLRELEADRDSARDEIADLESQVDDLEMDEMVEALEDTDLVSDVESADEGDAQATMGSDDLPDPEADTDTAEDEPVEIEKDAKLETGKTTR